MCLSVATVLSQFSFQIFKTFQNKDLSQLCVKAVEPRRAHSQPSQQPSAFLLLALLGGPGDLGDPETAVDTDFSSVPTSGLSHECVQWVPAATKRRGWRFSTRNQVNHDPLNFKVYYSYYLQTCHDFHRCNCVLSPLTDSIE